MQLLSTLLHTLKLLLPALLPSWRFFDIIAPSPRIQIALFREEEESPQEWQEFRPRPKRVPFVKMLCRLIWNPRWNESLFLVSCAESLIENPTQHSENEILQRITDELKVSAANGEVMKATRLQFRLVLIQRQGEQLIENVVFYSRVKSLHIWDAA